MRMQVLRADLTKHENQISVSNIVGIRRCNSDTHQWLEGSYGLCVEATTSKKGLTC